MRLWTKKAEQLHEKAEILFPGDKIANETYQDILKNSNIVKKKLRIRLLLTVGVIIIFVAFFAATPNQGYHNPKTGLSTYFLTFDGGAKLELMTKPEIVDQPKDPNRTGFVHICIKVDSREKLDEIVDRFHKENFHIFYEPATTGGHEVRAVTFEDLILEVGC